MAISTERIRLAATRTLFTAFCAFLVSEPLTSWAQDGARLLEAVAVTRSASAIDVSFEFNCHVRYLSHTPAQDGDILHVQLALAADCPEAATEVLPPPVGESLIKSIEMDALLTRQADLTVAWAQKEAFVVSPSVNSTGIRIRLLRPGVERNTSRVFIGEADPNATSGYAINLESAQTAFEPAALEKAGALLHARAYVSEVDVDGVHWYRLRIGPLATRAQAERALLAAQGQYPRAWLAIADERMAATPDDATEVASATPNQLGGGVLTAERIDSKQADALLKQAHTDLRRRDYDAAIKALTRLLRGVPAGERPEARELLGLARERNGQLAHAKAEYQAYLRDFPNERDADRVSRRLQALRTAGRSSRSKGLFGRDDNDPHAWRFYGGISQLYRRDSNQIDSSNQLSVGVTNSANTTFTSQNALLNDVDLVARRHGTQYDAISRVSAGYAKDLLPDGPGDRVRVSSAYFELTDRERGWSSRLGRQTRNTNGLLGTFDGIFGGYQFLPHLTLNAAFGYPVESSYRSPDTSRQFEALAVELGTFGTAWEPSIYVVNQTIDGITDRQAAGVEVHYFRPGRVFVGFVDYDVHFSELNGVVLIGTLSLPAQWTLNVDLEQRKSPILSTRNALIGQPVASFDDLFKVFDATQIEELAIDRAVDTQTIGLSLSRPLGEKWQFMLNTASFDSDDMEPSGGVEGIPSTGRETMVSTQLLGLSLLRPRDLHAIALRYQTGGTAQMQSMGLNSRLPLWGSWRLGPKLRADRRTLLSDDSTQWIYASALRLDAVHSRIWFELEVGAEYASRSSQTAEEKTTRYYGGVGWRLNF